MIFILDVMSEHAPRGLSVIAELFVKISYNVLLMLFYERLCVYL